MMLLGATAGLAGGAATAGTAAAGTAAAGAAAGGGFSLSSILSGLSTVGGIVATIAAGNAEAQKMEMMAQDAEDEKGFETLQSVDRKRSLLKAAQEAVGESDVAYAASGVDLSFGSARKARTDAYREADYGLDTESGTAATRLSRLQLRADNYRIMAKQAKSLGFFNAFTQGLGALA
jgi:hypothetical protein